MPKKFWKIERWPELESGRNYIIANKNTGTAYALTNNDGSVGATEVKIDGDRITSNDESIIFTAEGSDEVVSNIRNEESYLHVGMGRMSFENSAESDRSWNYDDDSKLTCKGSRSNYYLYYDGNEFRAGMDSMPVDESVSKEVYIFVQTEISPEPEPEPAVDPEPEPQPEKTAALITYALNGGTYNGSPADITETHNNGDIITIHEAPERDGYTFSYWKGSEYQPGESYTVDGDHTFTAVWTKNDEGSGGSGSDDSGNSKPNDSERPKTGDSGYAFYLMLLIGSAAALAAMLAARAMSFAKSKR